MTTRTPLPNRTLLRLGGPDTLSLLERLVTNRTQDWPAGETRYGALLTPQGKVLADFLALRTEDGVLLDADASVAEDLLKRLTLFRLRSKVELSLIEDCHVTVCKAEPGAGDDALDIFNDPRFPGGRRRIVLPGRAETTDLSAYHADRIANGVAEQGSDFGSGEVFPSDINMDQLGGLDLRKGCFVGQEVVSRMHRRGKIRRRTVTLSGDGLAPGAEVRADRPLGEVTSASGDMALARVRTDRLAQALANKQPLRQGDTEITAMLPDWLQAEMSAMEQA